MSIVDVFKKIGHGIKVVATTIAHGFVSLFGSEAAKKFVEASSSLLQSAVGQIVLKVVEDMQATDLDTNAKREAAVVEIMKIASEQAITVAESEVRLLIELAVQFVKGRFAIALPETATASS